MVIPREVVCCHTHLWGDGPQRTPVSSGRWDYPFLTQTDALNQKLNGCVNCCDGVVITKREKRKNKSKFCARLWNHFRPRLRTVDPVSFWIYMNVMKIVWGILGCHSHHWIGIVILLKATGRDIVVGVAGHIDGFETSFHVQWHPYGVACKVLTNIFLECCTLPPSHFGSAYWSSRTMSGHLCHHCKGSTCQCVLLLSLSLHVSVAALLPISATCWCLP